MDNEVLSCRVQVVMSINQLLGGYKGASSVIWDNIPTVADSMKIDPALLLQMNVSDVYRAQLD